MSWSTELAYFVTPKSGPMRAMRTLRDVNHALLDDLPARSRLQRHWFSVRRLLLSAANVFLARTARPNAGDAEGERAAVRRISSILKSDV